MSVCETDQDCTALMTCLEGCQDQTCADACATQYPGGQASYESMVTCILCSACPVSCSAEAGGACGV